MEKINAYLQGKKKYPLEVGLPPCTAIDKCFFRSWVLEKALLLYLISTPPSASAPLCSNGWILLCCSTNVPSCLSSRLLQHAYLGPFGDPAMLALSYSQHNRSPLTFPFRDPGHPPIFPCLWQPIGILLGAKADPYENIGNFWLMRCTVMPKYAITSIILNASHIPPNC